jgi:hypothetical protein
VLEAVPAPVATAISQRLHIPTIGIGAGPGCDGQVLVYHDLLGLFDKLQPRFVKRYAELRQVIVDALAAFRDEVTDGHFPPENHTYPMDTAEYEAFMAYLAETRWCTCGGECVRDVIREAYGQNSRITFTRRFTTIMNITIIGIGAMGCLFGAYLSQAANVTLLGHWPEQVAALRRSGLRLIGPDGQERQLQAQRRHSP